MNERLLPIGTIILLKNVKSKIMITSYFIFSTTNIDGKVYDYGGCAYPAGIVETGSAFAFNHDDIQEVVHLGYIDDDQKEMTKFLLDNEEEMKKAIKQKLSKKEA